ncbi:MAG: OprO/OprP family phosphate-selective porin [Janthinobacterium lividum]
MTKTQWGAALLAATAMTTMSATAVRAQATAAETVTDASPEEAAAQLEFLKAQVDALQAQLDSVKKAAGITTPAWKGAPEFASGSSGYKFKLSGELQFDSGYVSNPNDKINTPNLGFNSRSRRLLIGATGTLPGDFSYTFQFNLAEGVVDYEDMIIEFAPHKTPLTFTVGYFYPFSSMENMMSNRFTSFMERAQLNDATGNGRRLGVAATYVDKAGDFRIQAGAFNEGINGNPSPGNAATPANQNLFDRNGYQFSARTVYSPIVEGTQVHLGASFQYRRFRTTAEGLQYRARPFVQTTDQRLVGTGNIAAKGDEIFGVEAMAIHGPLHVAGEAQYVKVDGLRPGTVAPNTGTTILGTLYPQNPHFITGYGEVGYWLTGETRGYKNGKVDRTKILHPVSEGGAGGFQLVGRVDYIDLTDQVGSTVPNSFGLVNGGKQVGYQGALNYWPIDYVRLTAEYVHAQITGGPFAAAVMNTSSSAIPNRKYGSDVVAMRAQIDF